MKKQHFESKFEELIVKPLAEIGFKSQGKSIYYNSGTNNICLIRLGGRMSSSGNVTHVLCFRHSFLPNLDEKVSESFEKEVFAYPIKLKPREVLGILNAHITYYPLNLNFNYVSFAFSEKTDKQVDRYLESVKKAVLKLLDWAEVNEPRILAEQIKKSGEGAWIENLWLSAYEAYCTREQVPHSE